MAAQRFEKRIGGRRVMKLIEKTHQIQQPVIEINEVKEFMEQQHVVQEAEIFEISGLN